jgi:hypothetical protein
MTDQYFKWDQTDYRGSSYTAYSSEASLTYNEEEIPDLSQGYQATGSSIYIVRENREVARDLKVEVGNRTAPLIDQMLNNASGGRARRTTDVNVGWIDWKYVAYHDKQPTRHPDLFRLAYLSFGFHIDTPNLCVNIDGWIGFPFYACLDNTGKLCAYVDGWAFQFYGGNGFDGGDCGKNQATQALNSALPQGMDALQQLLDSLCQSANALSPHGFDQVYMLPGDGNRNLGTLHNGVQVNEDVGKHVSLAVLPRQAANLDALRYGMFKVEGVKSFPKDVNQIFSSESDNSDINHKPKPC